MGLFCCRPIQVQRAVFKAEDVGAGAAVPAGEQSRQEEPELRWVLHLQQAATAGAELGEIRGDPGDLHRDVMRSWRESRLCLGRFWSRTLLTLKGTNGPVFSPAQQLFCSGPAVAQVRSGCS